MIETKAYDKQTQISDDEKKKISCAKEFFKAMAKDGYPIHFCQQLNSKDVRTIIDEIMDKSSVE